MKNPIESIAIGKTFPTWGEINSAKNQNDKIATRNKVMSENLRRYAKKQGGAVNE